MTEKKTVCYLSFLGQYWLVDSDSLKDLRGYDPLWGTQPDALQAASQWKVSGWSQEGGKVLYKDDGRNMFQSSNGESGKAVTFFSLFGPPPAEW